jgi:hypothetical protein
VPSFGAVATRLRYDPPISVREATGRYSTLDYRTAWDPTLQDVVVFLPNGSRFVFWRGSSYIPFWAGRHNTGFSYEWAETTPPPDGFVDSVEPLMDKELRYSRVQIVESTAARVHVRWTYQSTDFQYKVWGDSAVEDYYFYPDGFGTRVLTLRSKPAADYELSEFIVLTPQSAYPLEVLPASITELLYLDGEKVRLPCPYPRLEPTFQAGKIPNPRNVPIVFRNHIHKEEAATAIYFCPGDTTTPIAFQPFHDRGYLVTPTYWGSHWPLGRGKSTGWSIDDRIDSNPAHNSVMTWGLNNRPTPLHTAEVPSLDTLGVSKTQAVRRWAWLIAMTDITDVRLLDWAASFSRPPSLELVGARLDFEAYVPERRALRIHVDHKTATLQLKPVMRSVNPVIEIVSAPGNLAGVTLDGRRLDGREYAWDGKTLWLNATFDRPAEIGLRFE